MHRLTDYKELLKDRGLLVKDGLSDQAEALVTDVSYDSRSIKNGALFVCKGAHFAPEYLQSAVTDGALAYVSEREYTLRAGEESAAPSGSGGRNGAFPFLIVNDIRRAMSVIADYYHDQVWKRLNLVGVTGTKGKTTTAYYMKSILDEWMLARGGKPAAILSSVENYDGLIREDSRLTTPETFELYRHFANAVSSGIEYLFMEVSSQALKYHRTYGLIFNIACFLNIGEDHISDIEHADFEDYFSSKLRIFSQCAAACVNIGARESGRILDAVRSSPANPRLMTFGLSEEADIYGYGVQPSEDGVRFQVRIGKDKDAAAEAFQISTAGVFNVENALAAISIAHCLGAPVRHIREGLKKAKVTGRMEVFKSKNGKTIIVDYAHNKLSFETLFQSVKQEYPGRKITIVFGCPGGKATGRRRELGAVAGLYADMAFLTEDDAGEESVMDICHEIAIYLKAANCPYLIIPDREEAVRLAVESAEDGAVILIAGKGRDAWQKRGMNRVPLPSDVDYVERLIK
ncbi:MAG: UDP-N-acetylmuramoyl-L-alanyl-D-glutamate--2,6-diaminopimelate ligase [Peptococcaceae bacterium]|jgi:UDP-N-acetylmuramoyl-L-alanyl-D-glutamate--2,6-diaminopimelate ligase|nr:UDP-N-acetylmuramoyl-L-alanyl-D-glutamate--2,6-diaminopimelate ligase [Peptococcaceae bacterium]